MSRPQAIRTFEKLYILSVVLGLALAAVTWQQRSSLLARTPALEQMPWLMSVSIVVGIGIAAMLWYLVARRGSTIGKWIVVAFAVWAFIQLGMLIYAVVVDPDVPINVIALSVAQNILYIIAATLLFRPDARDWFGETAVQVEPIA